MGRAGDPASATLRHYTHRSNTHLMVTEAVLNNTTVGANAPLQAELAVPWPAKALGGVAISSSPSSTGAPPGAACQLGLTAVAERRGLHVHCLRPGGRQMQRIYGGKWRRQRLRSVREVQIAKPRRPWGCNARAWP